MDLSPEERKRIYEEEKARIEAREQIEREKRKASTETSTGLEPNVSGLLCYIGGWISGIIFYALEQKNNWVRFHAAQSIVTFAAITVAGVILGLIPWVGQAFSTIVAIIGFILWIILMVKAYNGETYKLPWAGDIAERMAGLPAIRRKHDEPAAAAENIEDDAPPSASGQAMAETAVPTSEAGRDTGPDLEMQLDRRIHDYFERRRAGRITGSAFTVAWCIVLLVFFNFFSDYFAYYQADTTASAVIWSRYPLFTADISLWLPVLNTTLILSIIGHIFLIIFDRYIIRETIHIVLAAFALATVVVLLVVFPFDFNVIPNAVVTAGMYIGFTVALIGISIGIGISIIVRTIRLIVNLARGTASYDGRRG